MAKKKTARETEWIMVRVKRTTHARLEALESLWESHYRRTGRGLPVPDGTISIDALVSELLRRDAAHRARARRQRQQRRIEYRDPAPTWADPVTYGGVPGGPETPPVSRPLSTGDEHDHGHTTGADPGAGGADPAPRTGPRD